MLGALVAGHAVTAIAGPCALAGCATGFTPCGGVHPVETWFWLAIAGAGEPFALRTARWEAPVGGLHESIALDDGDAALVVVIGAGGVACRRVSRRCADIVVVGAIVTTAAGFAAAAAAIARGLVNGMTLGGVFAEGP